FSPEKQVIPYSFMLTHLCSNNAAEYQALIMGLDMAIDIGIQDLNIYGDSNLVVKQLTTEFEVRKDDLLPYHRRASILLNRLNSVRIEHVPRTANKIADALANLAATLALLPKERLNVPVSSQWVVTPSEDQEDIEVRIVSVSQIDKEDWRQPII